MDNYGGYKLKPKTHIIKPGDIVIRVKDGTILAPTGTIGIVLEDLFISLPHNNRWFNNYYEDWRAIETRPGSEAKVGNTVYCIKDTGGSCQVHDSFIVKGITKSSKFLSPPNKHTLLNGEIVSEYWTWLSDYFVVLVKADAVSEFPCFRQSIKSKAIVKFTGPSEGTVVHIGDSNYSLPYSSTNWINYNRRDRWTPCEDPSKQQEVEPTATTRSIDTIEEIVKSMFNSTPITTVSVDSMMNKPTQTKPNTKGKQMNSNLFTDILKLLAQAEQTDLEKAPSTYAFFYNNEGEYEGTARVANEAEAKALLQKPEHLGYTMRIYSFSNEFTTQIPVVSTIKKTVVTKPAIKPARKPRASKAN